jgi:prepilin-type N-terminal cleavage/methylation domain-containing protein
MQRDLISGPRRRAFTLVELLVVIAIIGVLVSLLLPAVQAAREAARRTQCLSQVKQLALALQNYESTYRLLPVNSNVGPRNGWPTAVLPYLEQTPLYDRYDQVRHWDDPVNAVSVAARLPVLLCPSADGNRDGFEYTRFTSSTPRFYLRGAPWDYTNTAGLSSRLNATLVPRAPSVDGVLAFTISRMAAVTDGTSNTVMLAECVNRPQLWQQRRRIDSIGAMIAPWSSTSDQPFVTGGVWASHLKGLVVDGAGANGDTRNLGPCAMNCSNDNELYAMHPGGVIVATTDGGARLLSQSTPVPVLAALVTRSGGETVQVP